MLRRSYGLKKQNRFKNDGYMFVFMKKRSLIDVAKALRFFAADGEMSFHKNS